MCHFRINPYELFRDHVFSCTIFCLSTISFSFTYFGYIYPCLVIVQAWGGGRKYDTFFWGLNWFFESVWKPFYRGFATSCFTCSNNLYHFKIFRAYTSLFYLAPCVAKRKRFFFKFEENSRYKLHSIQFNYFYYKTKHKKTQ